MDAIEFKQEMNTYYYRANTFHTQRIPDQDATSGNHHCINATYHVINSKLGNHSSFENDVKLFNSFVKSTEIAPGLYARHPNKLNDHQTHDDYIGMVVSSYILNNSYPAEYIRQYGEKNHWVYDTLQKPASFTTKFNNWHGRFPGLIGVYKRATGVKPSLFDRVGYCAALLADVYFKKDWTDTSGIILTWLSNTVMKGESKMVDYCIEKWEDKVKEKYEGQMGEVLGIYHGLNHPFSKAMWGKM